MKKFVAAIIILLIFSGVVPYARAGLPAQATEQEGRVSEKNDEEILKETVLLSRTVKEFEKTLGIYKIINDPTINKRLLGEYLNLIS